MNIYEYNKSIKKVIYVNLKTVNKFATNCVRAVNIFTQKIYQPATQKHKFIKNKILEKKTIIKSKYFFIFGDFLISSKNEKKKKKIT